MCKESYIEECLGDKFWCKNGTEINEYIFHRTDGPAIEFLDGSKEWYINGKLHREDGPAIDYINGFKFWYIDGKKNKLQ